LASAAKGASLRMGEAGMSTLRCEILGIILMFLLLFDNDIEVVNFQPAKLHFFFQTANTTLPFGYSALLFGFFGL
jgi:hypothetical protein